MYACITRETFAFTVFRRSSILKLELCRHACRRRDQVILTCRYATTALVCISAMLSICEYLLYFTELLMWSHATCKQLVWITV